MDLTVHRVAQRMFLAFERSFVVFTQLTRRAAFAFSKQDWQQLDSLSKQRIDVYEDNLKDAVRICQDALDDQQCGLNFWQSLKQEYQKLLPHHPQFELAETFYNSVIGRVCQHSRLNNDDMFVTSTRCHLPGYRRQRVMHQLIPDAEPVSTVANIFALYPLTAPFENTYRDNKRVVRCFLRHMGKHQFNDIYRVDLLRSVFYRNQQGFIVGRVCHGKQTTAFVIALATTDEGELYVDTVLLDKRHISALFGFARASFFVDTPCPAETVWFLRSLLPNKPSHELYSALGYYKHGKTEFYRDFALHLNHSQDLFELAPGIPGLVMAVFHLPSYDVVFKIIRDEFPESKPITKQDVKTRYHTIKRHDKVGRMADTSEYVNFQLPLDRVSNQVLNDLKTTCPSQLTIIGNTLTIQHLYIERRMTPLNLYLQKPMSDSHTRDVIDDLGTTIKEIAAAKLFPGDMLQKNFGITRHSRVIFYDYDEICPLVERDFRDLPSQDDPFAMDCLSVGPSDVFPEQFKHFIVTQPKHKKLLIEMHPEIFQASYWQSVKQSAKNNLSIVTLPYPKQLSFIRK